MRVNQFLKKLSLLSSDLNQTCSSNPYRESKKYRVLEDGS